MKNSTVVIKKSVLMTQPHQQVSPYGVFLLSVTNILPIQVSASESISEPRSSMKI